MLKDTDKTTFILEQYRADIDALGVQGEAAIAEAVAKAEKRAKACAQEWRQANKTVELTANQEKAVADARQAGEEKLAAAAAEEEDARIAAETVQRMIEDAATVRCVANKDTAKILERAENVLDETGARAALFFKDKKKQREDIEAAMLRLYATEKAVLYTLAKAERNEGEKLLAKIIADKKYEVSSAEFEVLKQQQNKDDLENQDQQQQRLLEQINEELDRAEKKVLACQEAEEEAQADFEQRLAQCGADTEEAVAKLQQQEDIYVQEKQAAESELSDASREAAEQESSSEKAFQHAEKVRRNNEEAQIKARNEQEATFAALEEQLNQRRQYAAGCNAAYIESVAKLDEAMAEAERLRGIVADYAAKAAEAAAEERSAREATETANRLAANAVKIRESISSESSQLLLHAQEVLMEAATSAQQLMDEKSILRQSAEKECQRVSEQAAAMEEVAREAEEQAGKAKAAWEAAEELLKQEQEAAERRREESKQNLEQLARKAGEERAAAEAEASRLRELADQAVERMNAAQTRLETVNGQLRQLIAEKQRLVSEGEERLQKLAQLAQDTLRELRNNKAKAEENVAVLQERAGATRDALAELASQIQVATEQLRNCVSRVSEIIQAGVAAIQAAEEDVQRRFGAEDAARREAEEAVASMSVTVSAMTKTEPEGAGLSGRDNLAKLTQIIESGAEQERLAAPPLPEQAPGPTEPAAALPVAGLGNEFELGQDVQAEAGPSPEPGLEEPPFPMAEQQDLFLEELDRETAGQAGFLAAEPDDDYQPLLEEEAAEYAAGNSIDLFDSPGLDANDEIFPGLTNEELEYTQRLESISNELLENTIIPLESEQASARTAVPQDNGDYQSWMENLARSMGDDDGEPLRQALPLKEEKKPLQPTAELDLAPLLARRAADDSDIDDEMPAISEAVIQRQEPHPVKGAEEDELRLSILSTVDENKDNKPKKRRFPFFS